MRLNWMKVFPTIIVFFAAAAYSAEADIVDCRNQADQRKQWSLSVCSTDYAGAEQSSCIQETEDAFQGEQSHCDQLNPEKAAARTAVQKRRTAASTAAAKKPIKKKPTRKLN